MDSTRWRLCAPRLNRTEKNKTYETNKTYKTYHMKDTINAYFAVLLVTIAGSGAALLIVHIATTDVLRAAARDTEASYAALQQSVLQNR